MKKLFTIVLISSLLLLFATTVNAATAEEVMAYASKSHDIAGKSISITGTDKVKLERFFQNHSITAEQGDTLISKMNEAITIMDNAGVTEVSKLSKTDKDKLVSTANAMATVVDVKIAFNDNNITVTEKDGTVLDVVSLQSSKLAYTGNDYNSYIVATIAGIIIIGIVYSVKRGFIQNVKYQ